MELLQSMVDSVETSIHLKLFSDKKDASYHHIFKSDYVLFPMNKCKDLENFNSEVRLSDNPYPADNRPRGKDDLDSVKYHRREIKKNGQVEPIWIAKKGNRYIKLDGVHRLVATYLENKRTIPAYIVTI
jgi:hypothetical protein